ncbi:MAG: FMN-binding protein [Peptoniphilus sp.]|uniref:FMN-binding protein n=1 Tax=Peptoniphilus sp. TaxID=1971214 RepID=UPI002A74DC3E|nr:FMN-binding protein [Peptoniphilus sp.]MDY2986625.1 FMN-binding protein [Peptoniphilus sp.]
MSKHGSKFVLTGVILCVFFSITSFALGKSVADNTLKSKAEAYKKPKHANLAIKDLENNDVIESNTYIDKEKGLKDGVYEGTAKGFKSDIKVSVKIESGKIKDIKVLENNDDKPYFNKAKSIISNIIERQSPDVETISGATFSSVGIKNAVIDALEKAGASELEKTSVKKSVHSAGVDGSYKKKLDQIAKMVEELSNEKITPNKLKDGTYEGSGKGFKGEIKVSVKVEDAKITDIKILKSSDDEPYFSNAKAVLDKILKMQSTKVDSVSGATFSSNGIKSAVRSALKQAGDDSIVSSPENNDSSNEENKEINKKLDLIISKFEESSESSKGYKDGTYKGKGKGYKDDIEVELTIKDGKIEKIDVLNSSDDEPYFSNAKAILDKIVESQSAKVDSVSGATYSSNGIKSAVRKALKQAGGKGDESDASQEISEKLDGISKENKELKKKIDALSKSINSSDNGEDPSSYKDGKYEGVGQGFKGSVKASVVVKDKKIESIDIIESSDDEPYFSNAKAVINKIIEKQSTKVDSISEATFSSNGIKSAVRNALKKGGGSEGGNDEIMGMLKAISKENKELKSEISRLNQNINFIDKGEETKGYKDGEYEGVGRGYKSDIKVVVKVSGGKIENIDIKEENEDRPYFNLAKNITKDMVKNQSAKVDSISNATYSSNGIKNAVRDALRKASIKEAGLSNNESKSDEMLKTLYDDNKIIKEKINSIEDWKATVTNQIQNIIRDLKNFINPNINYDEIKPREKNIKSDNRDGKYSGSGRGFLNFESADNKNVKAKNSISASVTIENNKIVDMKTTFEDSQNPGVYKGMFDRTMDNLWLKIKKTDSVEEAYQLISNMYDNIKPINKRGLYTTEQSKINKHFDGISGATFSTSGGLEALKKALEQYNSR